MKMAKKNDLASALMGVAQNSKDYSKTVAQKEPVPSVTPEDMVNNEFKVDPHYQTLFVMDLEDAPKEWNKYPRIKDVNPDKYVELKSDIAANGLHEAIRVWHTKGKYMIISGHNRKDILVELLKEYPEEKDKYNSVRCYVFEENEVDEKAVRREIHATNIHRDMADIDKRTQMEILDDKIDLLMDNKTPKGENVIMLAEKMGIKKSKLYDLLTIRKDLLPELKELYFSSKLSARAAVKVASLSTTVQKYICDKYLNKINTESVKEMPKEIFGKGVSDGVKEAELDAYFNKQKEKKVLKKVSVSIPPEREDEFNKLVEKWLKGEINI